MEAMSVPLCRLHSTQANARLLAVEEPPCLRLTTWST